MQVLFALGAILTQGIGLNSGLLANHSLVSVLFRFLSRCFSTMSAQMLEFLATVQKSDKFVTRAVEALAKNDIVELEELECANIAVIKEHVGSMSGGLCGFLELALRKYQTSVCHSKESVMGVAVEERIGAVEALLGPKPEKPPVHIALAPKVAALNLQGLPRTCWPCSAAVDQLAADYAKAKDKLKISSPFIYVELEKFLPSWCESGPNECLWEDAGIKKMDLGKWSVAFDRYAMAAACTDQLALAGAMAHKEQCLKVSMEAHLDKRGRLLGVFYDEVCRRAWAEAAVCGDVEFDLAAELVKFRSEANLQQAKNLYDEAKSKAVGKGVGKSLPVGDKVCYNCGKKGHLSPQCREGKSWCKTGIEFVKASPTRDGFA